MRGQFNKVKKLARQLKIESTKLDLMINAKWTFHYSETDDDRMIDTLDYGTDDITFEEFKARMDQYKIYLDRDGRFIAIP